MKKNIKRKRLYFLRDTNKWLLVLSLIFVFGGAFLILDASSISSVLYYGNDTPYYFFQRQLLFIFVALGISIVILLYPTKFYEKTSWGLVGVTLFLLIYAFIKKSLFSKGVDEVTLSLFGGRFQVAEFLKVFLIIYCASFYDKWINSKKTKKYGFLVPLAISFGSSFLIALGGDFGTAAIMLALYALLFISVPSRKKHVFMVKLVLFFGIVFCILGLKYAYKIIPEDTLSTHPRLSRFIYKNPCDRYEEQTGYQVCNGYIAIDNGGVKGVGLGNSVQKYLYLPESHTDFIFPIIIEEFGVVSGIAIILGYVIIIYIIIKEAINCYELQNSLICYGIALLVMLHVFINLGGVLGLIPVTGVPLPFLSYGGSFVIVMICSFAVVQRIHIENVEEKRFRLMKKEKMNE